VKEKQLDPQVCAFCGVTFVPKREGAKFHSDVCRMRAWRWLARLSHLEATAGSALSEIEEYIVFPEARDKALSILIRDRDALSDIIRAYGAKKR
jgi:hypothetical protein